MRICAHRRLPISTFRKAQSFSRRTPRSTSIHSTTASSPGSRVSGRRRSFTSSPSMSTAIRRPCSASFASVILWPTDTIGISQPFCTITRPRGRSRYCATALPVSGRIRCLQRRWSPGYRGVELVTAARAGLQSKQHQQLLHFAISTEIVEPVCADGRAHRNSEIATPGSGALQAHRGASAPRDGEALREGRSDRSVKGNTSLLGSGRNASPASTGGFDRRGNEASRIQCPRDHL